MKIKIILLLLILLTACGKKDFQEPEENIETEHEVIEIEEIKDIGSVIGDILVSNAGAMINDYNSVTLPEGYAVRAFVSGEIQGNNAFAVVVEELPGDFSEQRMLYVFVQNVVGDYEAVSHDITRLGGRAEGGPWGDSFADIGITNNMFIISFYGGSSDRWGTESYYVLSGEELALIYRESLSFNTLTGSGTRTIFYADTNIEEVRSIFYANDDFNNLLLYYDTENSRQLYPPMPSLYRMQFGVSENTRLNSSEALDIVKNNLFADFEQLAMPYTQEIMDNYAAILGYELPQYFYTDGIYMLSYAEQGNLPDYYRFEREGVFHQIRSTAGGDSTIILVDDETGEVITGIN